MNKNLVFHPPKIDFAARNYSPQFQDILNLMLQRDPKMRADLSVVCRTKVVQPYFAAVKNEEEKAMKAR